jgi:ABC-type amino acid transport substrate-binding protein
MAQPSNAPQTAAWSAPALNAAEKAWLHDHPVIRVGIDPGYAPYSSLDDNQQFHGVAVDFLAVIGAQLGIRFEISKLRRWTDILQAAQQRDIDLVATVVPVPGRERYLAFSDIYLQTPLVITARQDDHSLHDGSDLNGRLVALVRGYSSSAQVMAKYPGVKRVLVTTPLEGLVAVATGRADAYVGSMGVNLALTRQYGLSNLRIAATHDMENGQRFGVRSDWAVLATILDKALAAIPPAEKDRIHLRWVP